MKLKVGRTTNEVEFFDDAGNPVDILVESITMDLRPHEATKVTLHGVYLDELEIEAEDENVEILDTERC